MIIYKATNRSNGKVYIGQTIQPLHKRRSQHWLEAKKFFSNGRFQYAIRKYGKKVFDWEIIDRAETKEELDEKEQYWISYYNSTDDNFGYNIQRGGQPSGEKSKKGLAVIAALRSVPVYCHQTGLIYDSSSEAGRQLDICHTSIAECARGEIPHAKGHTFEHIDPNKTYPISLQPKIDYLKPLDSVYCHQNGKIYENVYIATKELSLGDSQNIRRHLDGRGRHVKGYSFEYVKDLALYPLPLRDFVEYKIKVNVPVICVNNGKEYISANHAARELNLSPSVIGKILKKKIPQCKGYKFIYKHELKTA